MQRAQIEEKVKEIVSEQLDVTIDKNHFQRFLSLFLRQKTWYNK